MHLPHAHKKRRRGRFALLVPLMLGAIAVLASNQPAPKFAGAVLGLVGESSRAGASGDVSASSLGVLSTSLAPIFEPAQSASVLTRPDIHVAQPSAQVVVRAGIGAAARAAVRIASGGKAVFLGDSYTTGWNGAGLGARGWPALVGRARGWKTVDLAVAGTGFINPGWTNQPIGSRVSAVIKQRPDVLFIAGGHNDSRWSASATGKAADAVIDRLHLALPDAVLVIVGPIWQNGSPPTRCLTLRDHLRRKAAAIDAIFIDPLAERWFAGSNHAFIGPDGIHPIDAGHRHMADRILADLAAAG